MLIIGITGPTGAGKTTALDALTDLGASVIDCDAVYHDLTARCEPMRQELRERFGADIFDEDGILRRRALGSVVFASAQALADLNAITHRYVGQEVRRRLEEARAAGHPAAAVDAIALLESGLCDLCGALVAVVAPDEVRVRRIMARDGIDERYARMRISAQKSDEFYRGKCDYELSNTAETPEDFREIARDFFRRLIGELREEKNEASR